MQTLIIGAGEVGNGLLAVLSKEYDTILHDPHKGILAAIRDYDIMHVCIPCADKEVFIRAVKQYQEDYKPKYTVIHSTVPVGTSSELGAIHSPIRGIHPNLKEGIQTFVKFLGGPQASEVADYFRRAGLKVVLFEKAETTELGKLMDTEYYRACIEFTHKVKALCDTYGLNFHEVYTLFNQTYNEGYKELNHPEYVRPVLQPIMKEIGGHCVRQNKELLEKYGNADAKNGS